MRGEQVEATILDWYSYPRGLVIQLISHEVFVHLIRKLPGVISRPSHQREECAIKGRGGKGTSGSIILF